MTPKLLRCRTSVKIVATLAMLTLQQQMVQSVPNEQNKAKVYGSKQPMVLFMRWQQVHCSAWQHSSSMRRTGHCNDAAQNPDLQTLCCVHDLTSGRIK